MNTRPALTAAEPASEGSLAIKVRASIYDITKMSVKRSLGFFTTCRSPKRIHHSKRILKEIRERIGFMVHVGSTT